MTVTTWNIESLDELKQWVGEEKDAATDDAAAVDPHDHDRDAAAYGRAEVLAEVLAILDKMPDIDADLDALHSIRTALDDARRWVDTPNPAYGNGAREQLETFWQMMHDAGYPLQNAQRYAYPYDDAAARSGVFLDRHAVRRVTRPATVDALDALLATVDPSDADVIATALNAYAVEER